MAAWEYPTTISAVLIAFGVIGKSTHWIYKWAQRVEASQKYIEREMHFNAGSTLRDAVKRIEIRQEQIGIRVVRIERNGHVGALAESVDAVHADISTLLDHDAERDVEGLRYSTPDEGTE